MATYATGTKQVECRELLDTYKRAFEEFETAKRRYKDDLKEWDRRRSAHQNHHHQLGEQPPVALTERDLALLREQQRLVFNDSPFVEWNGTPYACGDNESTSVPGAYEKCQCQQLYGGRAHLLPLSGAATAGAPSYERCLQLGYLDNHGLEQSMCVQHHPVAKQRLQHVVLPPCPHRTRLTAAAAPAPLPAAPVEPRPPILTLPPITCGPCQSQFRRLEQEFTYDNLAAVSECIDNIGRASAQPLPPLLPATPVQPPQTPPPPPSYMAAGERTAGTTPGRTSNASSNRGTGVLTPLLIALLALLAAVVVYTIVRDIRLHKRYAQCLTPGRDSGQRPCPGSAPPRQHSASRSLD